MTMTFNIAGNLSRDPKFEQFGDDNATLVRLGIASDRWFVDDGQRRSVPEFYDVTLFGENAEKFRDASKGDPVRIAGDVRPNRYIKDGVETFAMNFIGKDAQWQTKEAAKAARTARAADKTTSADQAAGQEHTTAARA